jgi:thiamine biosynthesis lipoprotein
MKRNAPSETCRARPLLGTFVEITADCGSRLFEKAFAAVEQVHRSMSYHDPASEVSRLNRDAAREPVVVSAWTREVLREAFELAEESNGAFDPTVAPAICGLGFLPITPGAPRADRHASWRDIELLPRRRIRFRRALRIDLGGIAKGFAVDRAIDVLRAGGCGSGLVNAGGDLHAFGPRDWQIGIRDAARPSADACVVPLRNAALATSAGYFTRRRRGGRTITALVDGRTRRPVDASLSASVIAPTALIADALTKVVLVLGSGANSILLRHEASAMILDGCGFRSIPALTQSHAS